jgi:hypothetical protein
MDYKIKRVRWKIVQIFSIVWFPFFAWGILVMPHFFGFKISVDIKFVVLLLGYTISVILFHIIFTRLAIIKLNEKHLSIEEFKITLSEIEGFCINRSAWFLKQVEIKFQGRLFHLYTYKFGASSLQFEILVKEFQTIMERYGKKSLGEIDLHPLELKFEKIQSKYALIMMVVVDLIYLSLYLLNILKFQYQILFINLMLLVMIAKGSIRKKEELEIPPKLTT